MIDQLTIARELRLKRERTVTFIFVCMPVCVLCIVLKQALPCGRFVSDFWNARCSLSKSRVRAHVLGLRTSAKKKNNNAYKVKNEFEIFMIDECGLTWNKEGMDTRTLACISE
jgi:hypothetical protein